MTVTFDREADALYIRFREGKAQRSNDISDGIVMDFDAEGEILGIEILHASVRIPEPHSISYTAEPAPVYKAGR